jgi:hypothetical protein
VLKSLKDVLQLPPLEWLIHDILPLYGLLVLGGTPKLGKSRSSLDLVQRVLRGRPGFGTFAPSARVTSGRVLYYNIEGGHYGVRERDKGIAPAQMFKFMNTEQRSRLFIEGDPILFTSARGQILRGAVNEAIAAWSGFDLVVLDPLVHFRGCDENNNQHTSALFRAIRVAAEQAKTSVVVVHHARKPSRNGDGPEDASESTGLELRGASAVFASADNIIMMGPSSAGLVCSFDLRYGPKRGTLTLQSDAVTGLLYPRVRYNNTIAPDAADWMADNGNDPVGYGRSFGVQPTLAERIMLQACN